MGTFQTNDTNITDIIKKIHEGKLQLPDFQRGWVWDDNRIKSLIASIASSYPIGVLMFLEYGGDSVNFKYRSIQGSNTEFEIIPESLILDGQQRMTSIYNALYSSKAVETKTEKNKKINRFYYLDMQKSLEEPVDWEEAILSVPENRVVTDNFGRDIILDLSSREFEFKNFMFPLNLTYDITKISEWRNSYNTFHEYNPETARLFDDFDSKVLRVFQAFEVPVTVLKKETPKEAVCQVFENVNTGGVSLTVFELVTASFAADNYELRKKWGNIRKHFDEVSEILKVVSPSDFLTAITLLTRYYNFTQGTGNAVSCKKKDVLSLELDDFKKYSSDLENGFIKASHFLKEQRIFTSRDMPYTTQLIPLSVLLSILGEKIYNSSVKQKISQWYWCGVLGEMYGGANETRYVNDVLGVLRWIDGGSEPETVLRAYFQPTRLLSLQTRNSAAYKGIMALILKAGALDFVSGTDMSFINFTDLAVDIHHIFPRAYSENKYPRERWNSIVNKTPLSARSNRSIGGNEPSKYLMQLERDNRVDEQTLNRYIKSHKIDPFYLRSNEFDGFFVNRSKEILSLISEAMGKPVSNLSTEEVILSFGASLE